MNPTDANNTALLDKLISSVEKAFRSYRLYEARGAQYESHVREMASQAALSTEQGPAMLTITPHGLQTNTERSKREHELNRTWFELFEQGARQIVFTKGIETREVREMLQIMAGEHHGDDILTVLWRRELNHIQISVARTLVRGIRSDMSAEEMLDAQYGHWRNLLVPDAQASDRRIEINPDDLRVLAVQRTPLQWCAECAEARESTESNPAPNFSGQSSGVAEFLSLLSPLDSDEIDSVMTNLIGSYARLGLTEKINELMSLADDHPALSGWSLERMLTAAGGVQALIPLIESGPEAFRESLSAMAASNADLIEELLGGIEAEAIREEVEALVITQEATPLAFHSARMNSPNLDEQLESIKALFNMGTDQANYLAIEGCGSVHPEVRLYVLSRLEPIFEESMRNSMLRLYRDTDEAVRIEVFRFIKRSGDRYFLREALATAKDAYFTRRSDDEQWEVISALAAHGNLPPINLLFCGYATSSSVWTNEHKRRVQLEAIRVLERYPTVDGVHSLKKLSRRLVGAKDIRAAAKAALDRMNARDNGDDSSSGAAS
ncbi:MAG: hypothetical protein VX127_11890 [Myxococcota bacterium]|nr:hypothetical protein [Myxococcota bacterium]